LRRAIICNMKVTLERIRRWGLKGGLGILDQGLHSGANFLLGILLARWISPEMYGGFAASYSLFLLFSTFQVALIAEPMSIFGADQYRKDLITYLNYLLRIQWFGVLLGALLLIFILLFLAKGVLRESMIAMVISLPFIFFYWFVRRAFYIEMQSGMAMMTSLIYSSLLILIIFYLQFMTGLTITAAYLAIALSSFIASSLALPRLGISFLGRHSWESSINPQLVNRELWNFGKWVLPAYLAGWLTSFSFPLFVSILMNSQSAGAYRALQNLFLPFQQFLAAITLLALPWLAKQRSDHGSARLFGLTQAIAAISGLIALIYCFLIIIFRHEIVALLYENSFYSSFDYLVVFLAISTLLGSVPLILGLALRVLDQPDTILWSKGCAAIFTVLFAIPIIKLFQMNGVIFALLGGVAVESFMMLFFYFRSRNLTASHLKDTLSF
jgi:O-antigen/teichoic acid export membrane protein